MSRYTLFLGDEPIMHSNYLLEVEYTKLIYSIFYHGPKKLAIAEDLTYKVEEVNSED